MTTPGAVAFLQPTIDALNERVRGAESATTSCAGSSPASRPKFPLDLLDQVGGRRRRLSAAQFEELKENLR